MMNILYPFIKGQTHIAISRSAKVSLALKRLLFVQIQTLPPSMHHMWKEIIDIVCKTTNGKS